MNNIFNIIENIGKENFIVLNVVFEEKYNVSIVKDTDSIKIYLYNIHNNELVKLINYSNGPYYIAKSFIIDKIDDIPMVYIYGFANTEIREYLDKYFMTTENELGLIDINKKF